jgi:cysteine desulfurase / selenocysteine lyase
MRGRDGGEQITVRANGVPYTPLDMTARKLTEIIRASATYINTEEESSASPSPSPRIARGAG